MSTEEQKALIEKISNLPIAIALTILDASEKVIIDKWKLQYENKRQELEAAEKTLKELEAFRFRHSTKQVYPEVREAYRD